MKNSDLEGLQAELHECGAKDVKFLFNADIKSRPPSTVQAQASFLLRAYLNGKVSPRNPVGELSHT